MAGLEKGPFFSPDKEPKKISIHRDFEISPRSVTVQTHALLELFYHGIIRDSNLAMDFLKDNTIPYLSQAENGAESVYNRRGELFKDLKLELQEAAFYTFIIFANLPDNLTSAFLSMGFSRRGMVKAPETKDEFLKRIKELKIGIWQIADGRVAPNTTLEAYPKLLRTYGFFKVGSELPIKMPEAQKQKEEMGKDRLNELLKDIEINL